MNRTFIPQDVIEPGFALGASVSLLLFVKKSTPPVFPNNMATHTNMKSTLFNPKVHTLLPRFNLWRTVAAFDSALRQAVEYFIRVYVSQNNWHCASTSIKLRLPVYSLKVTPIERNKHNSFNAFNLSFSRSPIFSKSLDDIANVARNKFV